MARVYVPVCFLSCCQLVLVVLLASCGDEHPLRPAARIGTIVIDVLPDSIGGSWGLEGPSGSLGAGVGDTLMGGMACGRYRLTWGAVVGWSPPVPPVRSDSLVGGDTLSFQGTYTRIPDKGAVAVEVTPDTVAAPWLLTGPDLFSYPGSGSAVLGDLPVGQYTITWQDLDAWLNPLPYTLTAVVAKNDTTRFAHTYFPGPTYRGDLGIYHTAPPGPFAFSWEMTRSLDTDYFLAGQGDTTLVGLPQDFYYVRCKPIPGFVVEFPFQDHEGDVAIARVWEGRLEVVHAVYVPDEAGMGIVKVTVLPADLQAPWTLVGPYGSVLEQEGTFSYQVPPGEVTLTWGEVDGWAAPDPAEQRQELPYAGTVEFVGEYRSLAPLVVPDFSASAGDRSGGVDLAWSAVQYALEPIADYLVACSAAGVVTLETWDAARLVAAVGALPGQETFALALDASTDGLVPGQPTWFAVRARNDQGELSPPTPETMVVPTFEREITGQVADGQGAPLSGLPVEVTAEDGTSWQTTTDAAGGFIVTGVPSNWGFVLETRAEDLEPEAWFDYRFTAAASQDVHGLRIGLIPRHVTEPSCDWLYADYLDYVLQMTNTENPTNTRPDQILHKWDHWPLGVFMSDDPGHLDLDFPALTTLAMNQWNATMGQTLLVATDDSLAAEVVVVFSDAIPQVNGQVSVLAPAGVQFLGDTIPEKLGLYLNTAMDTEQRIIEVAMHELGHVLGITKHSLCSQAGYLMYISSAGALDDGMDDAIHPDERMLVQTIKALPQGADMAGYIRR